MARGQGRLAEKDRKRLEALAGYATIFRDPNARFGEIKTELSDGTLQLPWFEFNELGKRFLNMTYDVGWVQSFDWPSWAEGAEGKRFLADPTAAASATGAQIAKIITACVRGERFCDGTLEQTLERKVLLGIAERAEALLTKGDPCPTTIAQPRRSGRAE